MAMVQRPNTVGLMLCRKVVVVEAKTGNLTLEHVFERIKTDRFPSPPIHMMVYSVLTDGLGDFPLKLVVSRCDTLDEIYVRSLDVSFKDPRQHLRVLWTLRSCSFPVPGAYEFALQADGEPITQSIVQVSKN